MSSEVGSVVDPVPALAMRAIRATASRVDAVKCRRPAAWGDLEDRAIAVRPPFRRPVEVPIGGLDQPRVRVSAVRAIESVQLVTACCKSARLPP